MLTVTSSKTRMGVVVVWLALVAAATGTEARADAPCALISMPGQPSEAPRHAHRALPDFGGWWSPAGVTYRTPPHLEGIRFAGVNGELLGKVGFFLTPGSVSIVNRHGIVRHLDIGEDPLMKGDPQPQTSAYLAYWELGTLVVKTREDASAPGSLRVTERISLVDRDTLEYALHVIAPEKPTAPLEIRILFRRDSRDRGMSIPTSF